jgi:hemolysin activation/secretion protein
VRKLFIREYRVTGSKILTPVEIGDTVYPFLGPDRSLDDVESARKALEDAYHNRGYNTVQVQIPKQEGRGGIVFLEVVENKVGRLRVKGSRYFSLDAIRKSVPALAPGTVPNFNELQKQLIAVNQWPDRRVTVGEGGRRAGVEPGTVDIDLTVKDTPPLHGSLELNNRYSPDTTPLRINGGISYNNLWQLGHAAGFSFQVSPEDTSQVKVYSGYYLARLPGVDWLTLTLQATDQDSNVSTISDTAVAGKGQTYGFRAGINLPPLGNKNVTYVHSLTFGVDYKHYDQATTLGATSLAPTATDAPVTYFPISFVYSGTWLPADGRGATTLDLGVYFSFRGTGSADTEFDNLRFLARGDFIYFKGDLSHEHELPYGFQVFGKVQGQIADQPLISNEQFAAGGLSSVRGYLEGEVPGDNAIAASIELRSPSLLSWFSGKPGDLRVYGFFDTAYVTINDPLPEQTAYWTLASLGGGARLNLFDHLHSSLDAGFPLTTQTSTDAHHWLLTFRVWGDF